MGSMVESSNTHWPVQVYVESSDATPDSIAMDADEAVRRTKDLAAGGVLLTAVAAFVAGLIVFVPKLIDLL